MSKHFVLLPVITLLLLTGALYQIYKLSSMRKYQVKLYSQFFCHYFFTTFPLLSKNCRTQ